MLNRHQNIIAIESIAQINPAFKVVNLTKSLQNPTAIFFIPVVRDCRRNQHL
jgi:hypothetical protein